jgi:prophage antirepressor-like protein
MTVNFTSLFDFQGHNIRVVTLDDTPWFLAVDVSKALGLSSQAQVKALLNLTLRDVQDYRVPNTKGRLNKIVSEAGVYGITIQSRKPEAKVFQAWVTGTVLTAIRKDGGYIKCGRGRRQGD